MSTTTIRIPDELKARLSRIAEQEGTSTHGLILEAIAEKADALERRQAFHEEARERHEHFLADRRVDPMGGDARLPAPPRAWRGRAAACRASTPEVTHDPGRHCHPGRA